ncbi:MAG: outer membrane protein assembly factor BamD [Flavobacteriaceae bacterium]|nr:outer membrane protein assembly factor BamD [Flavobacteriaceae bacterium]
MKKLFYILALSILYTSCSKYQRALKSENISEKFTVGTEMFDAGKYNKANSILGQIVPKYRGKPQAEKLMYMFSMTLYHTKDYYTSSYQMERFVSSYPKSEKVEEMAFLAAKSYYNISPVYSKEQNETIEGIEKLQNFINTYPESQYIAEANILVKELDYKLEKKAFSIAKQYNRISDYQASIKSFDNFLLDYPGSFFKEDALFYRFDAAYKLAINSVEWKKQERTNKAKSYFNSLKKSFADSKYLMQANAMIEELNTILKQYETKS